MQIESWARFLLPKETKRVSVKRVTDEVVVLATEEDDTLSLDLHTWELLAFHANKLTENWRTEECVVSRDARWFWRAQEKAHGPYQERRVQVLELSTQRCVREIGEADSLFTVIGSHAAEIGIVRDSSTSMHYSRGAPVSGYVAKEWLTSAVQAPSGEGLVGAYADESRDGVLVLLGPIGPGSPRRETVIEGSSGEAIHQLAVALEHGILVVWYFADQAYWLETFVEQQGHLKSQYRSEVSKGALLLTDRNGRRVWLIGSDDGKPVSREITREPRYFVFDEAPRRYLRHFSMELWDCYGGHQSDETDPPASPITTAAGVWRVVKDAQMGGAVGPERLHSELQRIRVTSGLYHVAELLKLALVWAFPRDAAMLLARADSFASLEQWGNVHRSLRTLNLEKVPEYRKQHAYHLLALCALMGLDFDAARELRRSAVGLDGNCDWSLINELTQENLDWELGNPQDEPLDELEDEPEDEKRQNSGILALRRALRDADALLAVGNPRAAFAAAAVPELLHWDDERLLACASEALLQFEPEGIGERLRREYIVSAFLALARDRFAHRYLLPVKEAWDAGRIAAVRERAIRQFERDTGALPALGIGAIAPIRIEREFADGALVLEWPPLLAHERLLELHPGLLQGFSELLEKLSSDRSEGLAAVFDEGELLADPRVWSIAEAERARLVREEVPAPTAVHKLDELGPHLAYLMNHSLAGRRSYWVTEDLARQLRAPDPSVSAQRLAESTKCHCFAFADADTLCIAEKLVAHDRQCPLAGKRLAVLTAYTWSTASESEPPMLAVRLLFVPETEAMAYRVAREIECDRAVDFDTVLNSHRSDRLEAALDPLVDAPELEVLLAMVLRALLQVSAPGAEVRDLGKRSGGKSVKLPSPLGLDGETLRMGANTGYTGDHVLQMLGSVRMGNSD